MSSRGLIIGNVDTMGCIAHFANIARGLLHLPMPKKTSPGAAVPKTALGLLRWLTVGNGTTGEAAIFLAFALLQAHI